MPTIDCLRADHVSENDTFPLFIGFMSAQELRQVATAPQFDTKTPHEVIAGNISATPVREWQRPIDSDRVDEIARIFARQYELMPNAVLLAAPDPSRVTFTAQGGSLWTLDFPAPNDTPPLWILDGQHRIAGLSMANSVDQIPFVLLASQGNSALYQDSTFAKIFAQVTTTAEGLHPLHDEWLQFAFRLGKYDATSPTQGLKNAQQAKAMAAVVALCHTRHLDTAGTKANPFFDRIAFNPGAPSRRTPSPVIGPISGGFALDASSFQQLVYSSYYGSNALPSGEATPEVVAHNVGQAYTALVEAHKAAHRAESVLLNTAGAAGAKGHKALQEGFLHGVLRYLAIHGPTDDWSAVLERRAFRSTDWRSSSWATGTRSGTEGTLNKKMARSIFETLFSVNLSALYLPGVDPGATVNLADYFKGDIGWGIELQGRRRSDSGRLTKYSGTLDPRVKIVAGTSKAYLDLGDHRTVSIGVRTPNVISVEVADVKRPFESNWTYRGLLAGLDLDPNAHLHTRPAEIRLNITFYGGVQKDAILAIEWTA
jgi:DGQHR domain-containing protein